MIIGSTCFIIIIFALSRPAMISPSMQQLCPENTHKLLHQKDSNNKQTHYLIADYLMADKITAKDVAE
jgi:hypothetical protein